MNKFFCTLITLSSLFANAQILVSAKANLLFPTDAPTWSNVSGTALQAYETNGKTNIGFNVGLSLKVNLIKELFVMPELYFTTLNNKHTDPFSNTTITAKTNRADLPILVGYDIWKDNLGVFAGPVASYNLNTEKKYNDFVENAKNKFTLGYQFGVQLKIRNLIFSGRYEDSFTDDQRDFINDVTNQTIRYDDRSAMFLAGVGYAF